MTPADIERAVAALRRAFPCVADEGAERFRRELAPHDARDAVEHGMRLGWRECEQDPSIMLLLPTAWASPLAEVRPVRDRWRIEILSRRDTDCERYAATRSEAMRAAERALGLPECEVVNG